MIFFIETYPPSVTGPLTLTVTYQQQQNFHVVASSNISSKLVYSIEANGTNVSIDPDTGNATWFVDSIDFRLKFVVTDSFNNTASLSPTVTLCYCLNGATCDPAVMNSQSQPINNLLFYGECSCAPGFAGAFCQETVSYCTEDPCFEGVNCTDNATTKAADCDPCPTGYIGDGRKCFGMYHNFLTYDLLSLFLIFIWYFCIIDMSLLLKACILKMSEIKFFFALAFVL